MAMWKNYAVIVLLFFVTRSSQAEFRLVSEAMVPSRLDDTYRGNITTSAFPLPDGNFLIPDSSFSDKKLHRFSPDGNLLDTYSIKGIQSPLFQLDKAGALYVDQSFSYSNYRAYKFHDLGRENFSSTFPCLYRPYIHAEGVMSCEGSEQTAGYFVLYDNYGSLRSMLPGISFLDYDIRSFAGRLLLLRRLPEQKQAQILFLDHKKQQADKVISVSDIDMGVGVSETSDGRLILIPNKGDEIIIVDQNLKERRIAKNLNEENLPYLRFSTTEPRVFSDGTIAFYFGKVAGLAIVRPDNEVIVHVGKGRYDAQLVMMNDFLYATLSGKLLKIDSVGSVVAFAKISDKAKTALFVGKDQKNIYVYNLYDGVTAYTQDLTLLNTFPGMQMYFEKDRFVGSVFGRSFLRAFPQGEEKPGIMDTAHILNEKAEIVQTVPLGKCCYGSVGLVPFQKVTADQIALATRDEEFKPLVRVFNKNLTYKDFSLKEGELVSNLESIGNDRFVVSTVSGKESTQLLKMSIFSSK